MQHPLTIRTKAHVPFTAWIVLGVLLCGLVLVIVAFAAASQASFVSEGR